MKDVTPPLNPAQQLQLLSVRAQIKKYGGKKAYREEMKRRSNKRWNKK